MFAQYYMHGDIFSMFLYNSALPFVKGLKHFLMNVDCACPLHTQAWILENFTTAHVTLMKETTQGNTDIIIYVIQCDLKGMTLQKNATVLLL